MSTVVLPLPGTASSSTGPLTASTAARCWSFRAARWAVSNIALSMAAPFVQYKSPRSRGRTCAARSFTGGRPPIGRPRAGHARPLQCFPIVPYIPHKSKAAGPCPPCRAVIACVKTGLTCIVPLSPVNEFYGQSRGPGMPGPYFSISPLCRCDYKCQPCKV